MAAEAGSIRPVLLLGAGFLILAAVGMGLWTGGWDVGKKRTDVDLQIESEEVGGSRGGGGTERKGQPERESKLAKRLKAALEQSGAAREMQAMASADKRMQYLSERLPTLSLNDGRHLLNVAASDPSPNVRIDAIGLVGNLLDPDFQEGFLTDMLQDANDRVRDIAFHKVGEREVVGRVELLSRVLDSPNHETIKTAVDHLSMYRTKSSNEVLIRAAVSNADGAKVSEFLAAVNRSLERNFGSASEASSWWSENQVLFSEDMSQAVNP